MKHKWKEVNRETALQLFLSGKLVYCLYEDGTEGAVQEVRDIHVHVDGKFGTEIEKEENKLDYLQAFDDVTEAWGVSLKELLSFITSLLEKGFELDHVDRILSDEDTRIHDDLNDAILNGISEECLYQLLDCDKEEFLSRNYMYVCEGGKVIQLME